MQSVAVPGVGNLPVTTAFVYSGQAFGPDFAQITRRSVPEPSTLVLAGLRQRRSLARAGGDVRSR